MPTIDLSQLPPPEVIETLNFETILADLKSDLVARHPECEPLLSLESEPLVKLLEVAAYREMGLRARYNDEARALLLAFSTGADLDHIGVTYYDGEQRLLVSPGDPESNPPTQDVWASDEAFRQRLALKPESYSVAGPSEAYRFHALSAHGMVKAASVASPIPGTTAIYILSSEGNGIPSAEILTAVGSALNSESIRPLSEEVLVHPASIVEYTIDVDLYVFPGPSGDIVLASAISELGKYAAAAHTVGGDITYSALAAAAHRTGVKRAIVNSPAGDVMCDLSQAPYCTGINVRIAGVES